MKKYLFTFLVMFLIAIGSWAQNTLVTIGTATTASATNGPIVVNASNPTGYFSRHIGLYSAAEINATPFAARVITKVAWYKDAAAGYTTTGGYLRIYLKQTTATTLGNIIGVNWTSEMTGATLVYDVNSPSIAAGTGWKDFTLATPFVYDGTSNLEVFVEWTATGNITNSLDWAYTPGAGNISVSTISPLTSGIPANFNRPNIRFTFTTFNNDAGVQAITSPSGQIAPGVPNPVQITLKNFGFNALTSATIGWELNNVSQPDYTYNGSIASGQTAGITLATQAFPTGAYTIKAYPKTVNGVQDSFHANDTATTQFVSCASLSGSYTINKNLPASATNFPSFTAASQLLNSCGITGAVTFTVAPGSGPYNESIELININGTSATNTVTFEGSGETLSSSSPAVVMLDRADYVKINNLVISQLNAVTNSDQCMGVQLKGSSDYIIISNCTINMPLTSGSKVTGIMIGQGDGTTTGNHSSHSLFQNNIINGGYYAMRMTGLAVTGSSPVGAADLRILGNQFRDYYTHGIYMSQADGVLIEGNTFTRPTRTSVSSFNGVYITSGSINTVVSKNRFYNTHGGATSTNSNVIPITVDVAAAVGSENIIKNNVFYNLNNTSNVTGISLFSSTAGVLIYHNTIFLEDPNRVASNTNVIRGLSLSGTGANVKFFNNIVSINIPGTGAKHAIYIGNTPNATFASNNNDLYIASGLTNAYTGAIGPTSTLTNYATLANWRGANTTAPFDVNSVDSNPVFVNPATGNFTPTSPDVNNIGQPLAAVTDDILGNTRSATTPDPGAYEFSLGTNDAGIAGFVTPVSPALPAVSLPVQVTLKNYGSAALTSATIGWKVNGVMQPDYAWTGMLTQNATAAVTIGNFTFANGTHTVCAWTKSPNGGTDTNAANDSSCTTINACAPLVGNYTINKNLPNSASNFSSFAAAADRLHTCGVSGRVKISVVPSSGPYNEQVDLLSIPGASATNSIVFEGNGNTLTATPTVAKTTVLKLDNADFVRINNLIITLTGTPAAGNPTFCAVQLVNNADSDSISNCTINMPFVIGTNLYVMGILAGTDVTTAGNNTSNSVFMNNTINGGLYGIRLNGNTGGTNAVNNKVTGNVIRNSYNYGIALDNADGSLLANNEISRPGLPSPGTYYAISLMGASKNTRISKNRIHTLWGGINSPTGISYGFNITGAGASTAAAANQIDNNLFYDDSNANTYGFYLNGASGINIYHNTIVCGASGKDFYGLYQLGATAANIKFNNNIIALTNTGSSGLIYAIYLAVPIETNNNVYYLNPGATTAKIGNYAATDYNTLTAWKAANSNAFDQLSVADNPIFVTVGTDEFVPTSAAVNNIGKPLPAVTTDIINNPRSATTPDPGVYEFVPVNDDTGVIAIVSPNSGCGLTNQETVTITIKNFASTTQTNIPVSYTLDGGAPVTETFVGSLAFNATVNYSFTTKADLSAQGPHTIVAKTNLTNDGRASNDALSLNLVNATQLVLPLAIDFETPASGINNFFTVVKSRSAIVEGAGASNGGTSTKGLIMDGTDDASWVSPTGIASPWTSNPENFAGAYLCIPTASYLPTDTLLLAFDLKQLFKASNLNTNFRLTVNGQQFGPTYQPPFDPTVTPIVWNRIQVNLSQFLAQPFIKIGFESNTKEGYDNGNGTANLIDNINLIRIAGPQNPQGVKDNTLQGLVKVYPNPSAGGKFQVQLPVKGTSTLIVSDLTGKIVSQQQINSGNHLLDLSGNAKGVYLLKITSQAGTAVRKLVIE